MKKGDSNLEFKAGTRLGNCEKCHQPYEGGCLEHGPYIYIDNAEENQDEDFIPYAQETDIKNRPVSGKENVFHSCFCSAYIGDVDVLSKEDCGYTESDEMSMWDGNTKTPSASVRDYGLQNNEEIKTHTRGKLSMCDVNGAKLFQCSSNLKRHKRIQTDESPYKCDVCGVGYNLKHCLKNHKKTHARGKTFKCHVCGVVFACQKILKEHKSTHLSEKRYKCDECNLSFNFKISLLKHKVTHGNEKPYRCDLCGISFALQGSLNIHSRTHTGEKAHKCDECDSSFDDKKDLKLHKNLHELGMP